MSQPQHTPRTDLGQPLDRSQDPDRFVPDEPGASAGSVPLDPALDPDRYRPDVPVDLTLGLPAYAGQTLPDLLGEGAQEERRDTYTWLLGLIGILAFLGLVSLIAHL